MPVLRILLLPFSILYKLITDFRNHLYDIGNKKSVEFDRYVISVGNLTVGGTGKTPFVELLVRQLKENYKLAVLSRGYKRSTRGFRLADQNDNSLTIGDEPFQYFTKFRREIVVAVGEERALAIPEILIQKEETQVIILDDAYQHRSVKPQLNILLSDYNRPFYEDQVLPVGRLRESRKHANRADAIIVTKCPETLSDKSMASIETKVKEYASEKTPIFFSGIEYLEPVSVFAEHPFNENVFLFSGIANSFALEQYVTDKYNLLGHKIFPDHHSFTKEDLEEVIQLFQNSGKEKKCILTTEKDMVRLLSFGEEARFLMDFPIFYLPIELYFLRNGDFFATYLSDKVEQGTK